MKSIAAMPAFERPREKLRDRGVQTLSDLELLAVLLGSGTARCGVFGLASRLLGYLNDDPSPDPERLMRLEGIGPARAAQVCAALEFSRRRIRPSHQRVSVSSDVMPLVAHYAARRRERLICISLNGANEVLAVRVVSVGLADRTPVHPREVFADPIADRATAIIVAHNHPSGLLEPSREDIAATHRLQAAGRTLGIELLDHIIFTATGHISLRERGCFESEPSIN